MLDHVLHRLRQWSATARTATADALPPISQTQAQDEQTYVLLAATQESLGVISRSIPVWYPGRE